VSLGIMDGAVVDGLDLLATVRALEAQGSGADGRTPALLVALNDFVTRCIREGRELWAGET
jgi:hypothetical protein